jgi:hypothetical protein
MEKIRIDFFDILGYLVPGSVLLIILWIAADSQVKSIWQIYNSVHNVDKKSIFIGLFLSYILGFTLHILGSYLYSLYFNKIVIKKRTTNGINLTVSEKWTIIREFGEKHIILLERWYALRAFSQNLSAISMISICICFYKWWEFRYYEWLVFLVVFIIAMIVFMVRACIFNNVLKEDMDATITKLKLDSKI